MKEQATQLPIKKEIGPIRASNFNAIFDNMRDTFDSIARRAYELFESHGSQPGHDLENWFRAENEFFHPTHVEIREANGMVQVRAEVPGFEAKDLEVSIEPNRLTIAGKRETSQKEEKENILYSECHSNQMFRSVALPVEVNAERASATLKEGVLELNIPKAVEAPTAKKVKVRAKTA